MKTWWLGALVIAVSTTVLPIDSEAKRLGGGGSQGMQRSLPARSTPDSVPARPATPNQAAPAAAATGATAAAAAPKRSWMGPIAGLAAGLGLAALASHLGFGEGLANFMMLALLAVVAVIAIRFLMNRFGSRSARPGAMAMAGAGSNASGASTPAQQAWQATAGQSNPMLKESFAQPTAATLATSGAASAGLATAGSPVRLPAGFDVAEFERIAKMIFIRLQAANDAGDLDDLRRFTTPEMFAAARLDLQERSGASQQTDVVQVEAEVLDVAEEADRQIASVRFHGMIREEPGVQPSAFDEVWHLTKPSRGDGGWLIAGIQQRG